MLQTTSKKRFKKKTLNNRNKKVKKEKEREREREKTKGRPVGLSAKVHGVIVALRQKGRRNETHYSVKQRNPQAINKWDSFHISIITREGCNREGEEDFFYMGSR